MKKMFISGVLALLLSPIAQAANSPWYMGLIGGLMERGTGLGDSALNAGFNIGYRNNRYLSTEFEYSRSLIDGDTPSGNDWQVTTQSIYAAFRSNTRVKLKGKVGLTNIGGGIDDTELSLGIGLSYWALGGLTEIEYTEVSDNDALNFFSVGVKYFF